jgi:hypothetical protein
MDFKVNLKDGKSVILHDYICYEKINNNLFQSRKDWKSCYGITPCEENKNGHPQPFGCTIKTVDILSIELTPKQYTIMTILFTKEEANQFNNLDNYTRSIELDKLLKQKTGDNALTLKEKGFFPIQKVDGASVWAKKESAEGFTAKEYSAITRDRIPNQDNGSMLQEIDGKVFSLPENGNWSIACGADAHSSKYAKLVTACYQKTEIVVKVTDI